MTRAQAGERFGLLYALGFAVGFLLRWLDSPRAVGIAAAVAWSAAALWYGGWWLVLGIRDGSVRRALPEWGWAFVSLVIIAAGCGVATLVVLAVAGEPLDPDAIGVGAMLGTFGVITGWWLLRGRHQQ